MSTVIDKANSKVIEKINFIDLKLQQQQIRGQIDSALQQVLEHGSYVGGPEILCLESRLKEFCGAKHILTCANGTDALSLALLSKNVKKGDAVFVPSFTFASTAEVVASLGATPVFIDIDTASFNMCSQSLEHAIDLASKANLSPKGVIAVDLFGRVADYNSIDNIASKYNLWVLSDAAQSFGAQSHGTKVGNFGFASTTSFFPAKPLGCYGDGGCIFTDDDDVANLIASLKSHGQGHNRNHYVRVGMNSRLDSFQAAILLEKLKIFPKELQQRAQVASSYNKLLDDKIKKPYLDSDSTSAWAQYTIVLPEAVNRDEVVKKLFERAIPCAVYYDRPLHRQPAYEKYTVITADILTNTDYLSKHVLSLPMHPYLTSEQLQYITGTLNTLI